MSLTFIWDLDGTLLDSYPVIMAALRESFSFYALPWQEAEIHKTIIRTSVHDLLLRYSKSHNVPFEALQARCTLLSRQKMNDIQAIADAKETLLRLQQQGARHFVYTHKGETTEAVLKRLELYSFFEDIITALHGFPRKPAPDALDHLLKQYDLDKSSTFYVGDRAIDMACARAAGIRGILYRPRESYAEANVGEAFCVQALREIPGLPYTR